MQHISRREMMEAQNSVAALMEFKGDKPAGVSSGVATSFGFKRRVVSAPPPTEPVRRFGDVAMETNSKKLEPPTINKFGFRSRSVSRTGSNNSINSNHGNQSTTINSNHSNQSTTTSLVKKPVDNHRNTLLVTNINKQPATGKTTSSHLVKSRSSSEHNARPSNLNRLTTTANTTGAPQDTTNVLRNINSRSGIPSLRPVSTSGIPSLTKYTSGNTTTGPASNLPPRGTSTRPVSWGSSPWGNGPVYNEKSAKPVYNNTRLRSQGQPAARPSRQAPQPVNSRLPRTRRLEMVASNNDRCRFELKDVEVTQMVPIKPDKKPPARGTVYATLCSTPVRRTLGSAKPTPPRPLSSLLSSSSDESDNSEQDTSPSDVTMKTVTQSGMMTSGSDMEGYPADLNEMDSMEGSGDTMALVFDEEEVAVLKQEAISPEQSLDVNPNMRSILLDIEDPAFAVLAAMSSNDRLEDVNAPDSPSTSESTDIGILACPQEKKVVASPPHEVPAKSVPPALQAPSDLKAPPELESPSTPTNVSFSDGEGEGGRGQDFLIDDEISDQPGLVFDEEHSSTLHRRDQSLQKLNSLQCQDSPARSRGTLSPCSSITSEDLMLDFELSEVDGSQRLNDIDRTIENVYISNPPNALSSAVRKGPNNNNLCNNNNNYLGEKCAGSESTYVGKEEPARDEYEDEEDNVSVSTDSGYSFLGHLEDDVACIRTELVTLRNVLSRERDIFSEKEADLKRQIALLRHECMEQVRVASLLREELEIYKTKEQKQKLVTKSNVATQTEKPRPSSLGYVSEGSDGSTRSLISFRVGQGKFRRASNEHKPRVSFKQNAAASSKP